MALKALSATLFCLAIVFRVASIAPARAEDSTLTAAEKEKQTLESFAAANKTCQEWETAARSARDGRTPPSPVPSPASPANRRP